MMALRSLAVVGLSTLALVSCSPSDEAVSDFSAATTSHLVDASPAAELILGEGDSPEGFTYASIRDLYTEDAADSPVLVDFLKRVAEAMPTEPAECLAFLPDGQQPILLLGERPREVEMVEYHAATAQPVAGIAVLLDTGENLSVPEVAGCEEFRITLGLDEYTAEYPYAVEEFVSPNIVGFNTELAVRVFSTKQLADGESQELTASSLATSYLVIGTVDGVRLQFTVWGEAGLNHLEPLMRKQVEKVRAA